MSCAQEDHDGKISIGGRNIINLRFADDIDTLAEEEQELEALAEINIKEVLQEQKLHSKGETWATLRMSRQNPHKV